MSPITNASFSVRKSSRRRLPGFINSEDLCPHGGDRYWCDICVRESYRIYFTFNAQEA